MAQGHSSFRVDIDGLPQLRARLNRTERGLGNDVMKEINQRAGRIVMRTAVPTAPVRTGRLAASMRIRATAKTARITAGTGVRVPYAAVVHWGAPANRAERPKNIRAQPWLSEAAQGTEPVWQEVYRNGVQALLD